MSYTMPIELGKIREFARAVKTKNPAHKGDTPVIPPTLLVSSRTLWEPVAESGIAKLGFDMRRILHGEEEYIFHGPLPRAGQVLSCEAKVTDTYEKPGKRGGSMRFGGRQHSLGADFHDARWIGSRHACHRARFSRRL